MSSPSCPLHSMDSQNRPRSTRPRRLNAKGVAGTFYVSRRFCGATVDGIEQYGLDDLRRIVDNGHEIGCHTSERPRAPSFGAAELIAEAEVNAEFVRARFGDLRMTTFAFPFGHIDLKTKLRMMQGRFAACRSSSPGVNAGVADLGALRAQPLFSRSTDAAAVTSLIKRSSRPRSWLIFFTHDVEKSPSPRGCTPDLFEHALESALSMGCQVLPVRNALGWIRFRAQPQRRSPPS